MVGFDVKFPVFELDEAILGADVELPVFELDEAIGLEMKMFI
jgi:hypothetical protein